VTFCRAGSLARVTTYFRLHPEDENPEALLEPENQVSKPWGGADHGPCEKCGSSGRLDGFGECPSCKGSGEITDSERRGVSVFHDPDTLYRYMLRRDSDMDGSLLVELEGEQSEDVDFDADEGALLVFPKRIVKAVDIDRERIERLRHQL
jgi:hypothetical protein